MQPFGRRGFQRELGIIVARAQHAALTKENDMHSDQAATTGQRQYIDITFFTGYVLAFLNQA